MGLLNSLKGKITESDAADMFFKKDIKGLIKATRYHETNPATRNGGKIRQLAVQFLGDLRDKQAVPALIAALNDEDPLVRRGAGSYLTFFQGSADPQVPRHVKNLKNPDYISREASVTYLRDHNWTPENAEQEVLFWFGRSMIENVDEDKIRELGEKTIRPLLEFLEYFHTRDRRSAARWLGIIGNPAALDPLLNLEYNDVAPSVREAATEAIRRIRGYS
ncbi:MAG: PBS lyase HEAT-like repeat protein [Methanoregula sp. PtaU1.Bin051]|nr:MAG: PBS lyase HEAT-like repeat protein [Methanoregula sp. PtaU1.Bin051]